MKKIVYLLGNPLLKSDSIPIKLLPQLKKFCPDVSFQVFDPTEELQFDTKQNLTVIDAVIGIDKVTQFHDLDSFSFPPRVTVHDFDLLINLKILQKLKRVKDITIIGVPTKGKKMVILKEIINALHNQLTFKK